MAKYIRGVGERGAAFTVRGATRFVLVLLAALSFGLAMQPVNWWFLAFPATAVVMLAARGRTLWQTYLLGATIGVVFYGAQTTWLTAYLGPEPWIALALLEGLLFGLGQVVLAFLWRRWDAIGSRRSALSGASMVAALALVWVAREWLNGHLPYGGFQWSRLGQMVADSDLRYWAYWGGISAVSLAVAVVGAWLAVSWRALRSGAKSNTQLVLIGATVPALLALLLPSLTPLVQASIANKADGTRLVAAVQGNANAGLFANPVPGSILLKHVHESLRMIRETTPPDFVVWPENASDIDPLSNQFAHQIVSQLVYDSLRTPLILGAVTYRGSNVYNSTIQFEPGLGAVAVYDKTRPVPFAEYVPDRPFWYAIAPNLIGLIERGFTFGTRSGVFDIAKTQVGSLICFEIAIDDVPHNLVTQGAKLILSQANNSDFGHTAETYQQEPLARLQAVATGRSVVHVSTVGVTEFIDANGNVTQRIPAFKRGYISQTVQLRSGITPAMRFYGWVDILAGAMVALVIIDACWRRLKRDPSVQPTSRISA